MIIVTGAAGFIGSCMVQRLNDAGYRNLVISDDFEHEAKRPNWDGKIFSTQVHRTLLPEWLEQNQRMVETVIHLGARTNTAEFDETLLYDLNTHYTRRLWDLCSTYQIPFIYASSAATYGNGYHGFTDNPELLDQLEPLNPYGWSKHVFDQFAVKQERFPFFWAGLKFFNVYGPNEYHKGRMASVIFHAFHQILETGKLKLFRSHRPDYADGGQVRDFIYVKDVCDVILWMMENRPARGLYNLGSGTARTFLDLGRAVFREIGMVENITYIDIPEDIREKYQYFTEADIGRLREAGYPAPFHSLEQGIHDYVQNYLLTNRCM